MEETELCQFSKTWGSSQCTRSLILGLVSSSQARQSKGQPGMDQDTGIKLQICSSVIISDTQPFPLHRHTCLMLIFIPVWEFAPGLGGFGRKSHQCSVPCSHLSWALRKSPFSRDLLVFAGCPQSLLFPVGIICKHPESPPPAWLSHVSLLMGVFNMPVKF